MILAISSSLWSILALIILFYGTRWKRNRSRLPLPPGPKKLPLIGNLLDLPSERQWEAYHKWSKEYNSDIIHIDAAGTSIVVLSSMEAVRDLFDRRSSLYSDRVSLPMLVELMGWDFGIDSRRAHRKIFHEAFNVNAAKQFHPQERVAAHRLLRRLLNDPKDIMQHFRHLAAGLIMDVTYGIDIRSPGDPYTTLAEEAVHGVSIATLPGRFLVNTIPALKYVPSWFPGAGFQRQAKEWRTAARGLLEMPFAHAQRNIALGSASPSFTSRSLAALEASPNNNKREHEDLIKGTAANMYAAGSDTTAATLGTFVYAMLANPKAQRKAQAELDALLGPGHLPDFADEVSLPYVSAVVKEVLRWKNVTPIAIPHFVSVDDEYRGYRIPAGSMVIGNTWAILHDEDMYPDPHAFKPERFLLDGKLESGRAEPRGGRLWVRQATYGHLFSLHYRASMLATLDIKKARDEHGNELEPSYEFFPGLVSPPLPFECSITPRSKKAVEIIHAASSGATNELQNNLWHLT
ncbi:cytochrome P450 [Mycena rosella]|uniref:Cytochrome P450 n=1 Tax=Mycena rosella TaxID=1033263 RepID=A0AAD7CQH7_MYCRO|nr:cytochrome P450 [Mycena rosella]